MNYPLPPRQDDGPIPVLAAAPGSVLVIVGANGAGKTRFAGYLTHELGERAIHVSALEGLYVAGGEGNPLAQKCMQRLRDVPGRSNEPRTPLEMLLETLLADELEVLIRHKVTGDKSPLPPTRLDGVIDFFQRIFPENRILLSGGRILFSRPGADDGYAAERLSDGERAALYYASAFAYAPQNAVIVVDTPEIFLHPTITGAVWDRLQALRPDCAVVYVTHDLDFTTSRRNARVLWVRSCNPGDGTWQYTLLPQSESLPPEVYQTILGARKPVLFIEGDERSIDFRLYPLIFREYTVKPLGSCNKVVEATRTFNDLSGLHHLRAMGIVDRDRRDVPEVEYLRRKNILVPEVAEIENLLLVPEVVEAVATHCGKRPDRVLAAVQKSVMAQFRHDLRQQALLHTRQRVKRTMEYRIDARFPDITALEQHLYRLPDELQPRRIYENLCREFHSYLNAGDYPAVLRVYNQKSMLPSSNVAGLCSLANKQAYIDTITTLLATDAPEADQIRQAVRKTLKANA